MSFPSWNWKGQTLWNMWDEVRLLGQVHTKLGYFWLRRYEPIEDEL